MIPEIWKEERCTMEVFIDIDFSSDEALYIQLRNQIVLGIATNRYHEGDVLPSVRQLADAIGINMHTVTKARKGAVISIDEGKQKAMVEIRQELLLILAKASCKNISRQEVHALIDEIYEEYGGLE